MGRKPIFTDDELTIIKKAVSNGTREFDMRGRKFVVRYFNWKKKPWVTVRPEEGFVPMFSAPVDEVKTAQII